MNAFSNRFHHSCSLVFNSVWSRLSRPLQKKIAGRKRKMLYSFYRKHGSDTKYLYANGRYVEIADKKPRHLF